MAAGLTLAGGTGAAVIAAVILYRIVSAWALVPLGWALWSTMPNPHLAQLGPAPELALPRSNDPRPVVSRLVWLLVSAPSTKGGAGNSAPRPERTSFSLAARAWRARRAFAVGWLTVRPS
jgi:hypothetical protein